MIQKIKRESKSISGLKLQEKFENDVLQEKIIKISYIVDVLINTIIKEFTLVINPLTEISIKDYQNLVLGEEYMVTSYIGNALYILNQNALKSIILKKQILDLKLNISRFEKESKITQMIHILSVGGIIWKKIKNIFYINLDDFKLPINEQKIALIGNLKRILTIALDQFEPECIPNKFKFYAM